MSERTDATQLAADLIDGKATEDALVGRDDDTQQALIAELLESSAGRRWLRASSLLDTRLADQLLAYGDDFSTSRHDATLAAVVETAGLEGIVGRAVDVAAGTGAPALWTRLAGHTSRFQAAFAAVRESDDSRALEATATHLLLDPASQYGLTGEQRQEIAVAIIETSVDAARAIAAEYLASSSPEVLAARIDTLALDQSASVRGFAWFAAFRSDRAAAANAATELLGDESVDVEIRRTALNAAGESLPTDELVGLLSYFVIHPNRDLALDAANLLHRYHRHPEIAMAAAGSPHEEVREIATRLMDPYRGSPAAGGSRPGDPLRSDPLLELMRRLEEEETKD